jgi:hypothetical protein
MSATRAERRRNEKAMESATFKRTFHQKHGKESPHCVSCSVSAIEAASHFIGEAQLCATGQTQLNKEIGICSGVVGVAIDSLFATGMSKAAVFMTLLDAGCFIGEEMTSPTKALPYPVFSPHGHDDSVPHPAPFLTGVPPQTAEAIRQATITEKPAGEQAA